ncbi:MAG: hypothetical protein WAZ27_02135 [Minisyncoccia bacterium]
MNMVGQSTCRRFLAPIIRYDVVMTIDSEKNARRMLAGGVLFATVGILALAITLMQPGIQAEQQRLADDVFDTEAEIAAKYEVLKALDASTATGTGRVQVSKEEKLRVLQALSEESGI